MFTIRTVWWALRLSIVCGTPGRHRGVVTRPELDHLVTELDRENAVYDVEGVLLNGMNMQRRTRQLVDVENEEVEPAIGLSTRRFAGRATSFRLHDAAFHDTYLHHLERGVVANLLATPRRAQSADTTRASGPGKKIDSWPSIQRTR